jgi:uncharacterized protein involved in oxidation of intracellular sulfur
LIRRAIHGGAGAGRARSARIRRGSTSARVDRRVQGFPAMAKTLLILNDPPYGTERSYNALRLAGALSKRDGEQVRVFLLGDAASCAKANQKTPQGYYNLELMLRGVARHGGEVGACGTCLDARGIAETELADGMRRSTLEQLTDWTQWADKVLVF